MGALDEYIQRLGALPPKEAEQLAADALAQVKDLVWIPNPGPQTDAYFSDADELLYGGEAGGGKGLALDTLIPTVAGFTTMGEVKTGDMLFDQDGNVCEVIGVSQVNHRPCFEITFDDGSVVVADDEHRWLTMTARDREGAIKLTDEWRTQRRSNRPSRAVAESQKPWASTSITIINREREHVYLPVPVPQIRNTAELHRTLYGKNGRLNHSVVVAAAIDGAHLELPIDPYLLGIWLGDGFSASGKIGMMTSDWADILPYIDRIVTQRRGDPRAMQPFETITFEAFARDLRCCGLLNNKHIPVNYLRASIEQRRELLRGLLDTDGHCDARGRIEIGLSNRRLAEDVQELICSLGHKVALTTKLLSMKSAAWKDSHRMALHLEFDAFKLPRKLARQREARRPTTRQRYVSSVTPIDSVPTKCISVNSPTKTYLVGRTFIPTHNTALVVGLSLTAHKRSLVLRRTNKEGEKLFDDYAKILGHENGCNRAKGWRIDGRIIDIGGCEQEKDRQKRKGIPHDLKAFDELVDFTQSQYEFIIAWNRSTEPGQRCRVVATTNPPTSPEGMWVVKRWAAWLDPKHPNPALSGELRWYTTIGESEVEVDGPGPHWIDGRDVLARSRTFIRARLDDNPDLTRTPDYAARLDALPKELREAYREGKFDASLRDQPFQAIPTEWIRMAQGRWEDHSPNGVPMCAIGVDASGGGEDPMIIAPRYDGWFAPIIEIPGKDIPADRPGKYAAGMVLSYRRDRAIVVVDMGGGYGGPTFEQLKENEIECISHKGSEGSVRRTADGQLKFKNKRTEVIWLFREALDPSQPGGSPIMLPADSMMMADLCTPTFKIESGQIVVESKEDVCKRLGRSTDRGDAVVMAWSAGPTYVTDGGMWLAKAEENRPFGRNPQVVMGRPNRR